MPWEDLLSAEECVEVVVKMCEFWRNSRRIVAVTAASPKAGVVAIMLC